MSKKNTTNSCQNEKQKPQTSEQEKKTNDGPPITHVGYAETPTGKLLLKLAEDPAGGMGIWASRHDGLATIDVTLSHEAMQIIVGAYLNHCKENNIKISLHPLVTIEEYKQYINEQKDPEQQN